MLYPILTPSRSLNDLNGVWEFKLDNGNGFEEEWFKKPLETPMTMPVPAAYNDLKEGVDFRDHYGWVFYQRTFSVPGFMKDQRVILRFDAVAHEAKVYINGELVCTHKGGFLPFEVEISDLAGKGECLLTVAVSNIIDYTTLPVGGKSSLLGGGLPGFEAKGPKKPVNNPNFDFFNYCGIIRPVRIYTTPKSYISDVTVTAEVKGEYAALNYRIDTIGEAAVWLKYLTEREIRWQRLREQRAY